MAGMMQVKLARFRNLKSGVNQQEVRYFINNPDETEIAHVPVLQLHDSRIITHFVALFTLQRYCMHTLQANISCNVDRSTGNLEDLTHNFALR